MYVSFFQAKAPGKILFDQVCLQLNLLEVDYFGLEYQDLSGITVRSTVLSFMAPYIHIASFHYASFHFMTSLLLLCSPEDCTISFQVLHHYVVFPVSPSSNMHNKKIFLRHSRRKHSVVKGMECPRDFCLFFFFGTYVVGKNLPYTSEPTRPHDWKHCQFQRYHSQVRLRKRESLKKKLK